MSSTKSNASLNLKCLPKHRVNKGSPYRFTLTSKPFGCYNINNDDVSSFYQQYCAEIHNKPQFPSLTEKPGEFSPILIDLDFKFDLDHGLYRAYDKDLIYNIVKSIYHSLSQTIELDYDNSECFVMERPKPYQAKSTIKDGLHLMLPHLFAPASLKHTVRKHLIQQFNEDFKNLGIINSIDDVVDEAVINRNNWYVYGSGKPEAGSPYLVTTIYRYDEFNNDISEDYNGYSLPELVRLLSVYGGKDNIKYLEIENTEQTQPISMEEENSSDTSRNPEETSIPILNNPAGQSDQETDRIKKLAIDFLKLLNPSRADAYQSWIEVGWALHNIDDSLLSNWINWSRQSSSFQEGKCETIWAATKPGLSIGSLIRWALEDDYDAAKKLQASNRMYDNKLHLAVDNAVYTGQSVSVAQIFQLLYPKDYVWPDSSAKRYYHFNGTYWQQHSSSGNVLQKLTSEIYPLFDDYIKTYQNLLSEADTDEKKKQYSKKMQLIRNVAKQLLNTGFRNQVLKEIAVLYEQENFEDRLDKQPDLLLFEDGVIDLRTKEFRSGLRDDFLTVSVGYNYPRQSGGYESAIHEYFSQCHTDEQKRKYFLQEKAQRLSGHQHGQTFALHTGSGSNSKSITFDLFKITFGGYFLTLPASVLTNRRNLPGTASPELANIKNARLVVAQEPERGLHLNASLIKQLAGGDEIEVRNLYCNLTRFTPQFKVDLCCNKMPVIDADDGGIIRRLRVLEWASQFKNSFEAANYDTAQFPAKDLKDLQSSFKLWRNDFMRLLLDTYQNKYIENPPLCVTNFTDDYLRENNYYVDFVDLFVEKSTPLDKTKFFTIKQASSRWGYFKSVMQESQGSRIPSVKESELKQGLSDVLNSTCHARHRVDGMDIIPRSVFIGFSLLDSPRHD